MEREPTFERIRPDELGRILDRRRIRVFYLQFLLLAVPWPLILGGWITAEESTDDTEEFLAGVLICLGILSFVANIVFGSFFINHYPARWYLRWLRERIERRTDPVVRSDDPAALFVQVIPRGNWRVIMGENASDVGLLVLDWERRELRYEGDLERWVIPAEAIQATHVHSFTPPTGISWLEGQTVLLLSARLPDGKDREIPLAPLQVHLEFWTPSRKRHRAELLERAIGCLVAPGRWPAVEDSDLRPLRPPHRSDDDADYGGPPER